MIRSFKLLGAAGALLGSLAGAPAAAADFTFQFVNETDRALAMKLFSRGETRREWPTRNRSYSVQPGAAVQELKIDCEEGEQICWGAWMGGQTPSGTIGGTHQRQGRTTKSVAGAGDRGLETCETCCHVCKGGGKAPVAKLSEGDFAAR